MWPKQCAHMKTAALRILFQARGQTNTTEAEAREPRKRERRESAGIEVENVRIRQTYTAGGRGSEPRKRGERRESAGMGS